MEQQWEKKENSTIEVKGSNTLLSLIDRTSGQKLSRKHDRWIR